jgi:hypothetical protein
MRHLASCRFSIEISRKNIKADKTSPQWMYGAFQSELISVKAKRFAFTLLQGQVLCE